MKKSARVLEMEQRLLASLATDAERAEMQAMLDLLWAQSIEISLLKVERDKAIREYQDATRALFTARRERK